MDPKTKGERTEAKVLSRLVELGYRVLTPFGESCEYDFVIDAGDELRRIQVKTGKKSHGKIIASLSRTRFNSNGATRGSYPEGSIDAFIIYSPEEDMTSWVDPVEAGDTQISIRIDPPHENHRTDKSINWAADYRL